MTKFEKGDILIDNRGNRYKVTIVRRENNHLPYETRYIAGEWIGHVRYFGANGEFYGTGASEDMFDVTLDPDYMISKMWEEYEV